MSRFRHTDILLEMIDLCQERMTEVRQQLVYYRASVYKDETSRQIASNIDQLRLVGDIFGDVMLQEAFQDYDAMTKSGVLHHVPGECSFSIRMTVLLTTLDRQLARLNQQLLSRSLPVSEEVLADAVIKHRNQLLARCRQGSRQWAFFEAL